MNPFVAKPGEAITGVGLDFFTRLATGETIATSSVTADAGLTVSAPSSQGTIAMATISVAAGQADAAFNVYYTVTGTAGSIRKGTRIVWVRANSE